MKSLEPSHVATKKQIVDLYLNRVPDRIIIQDIHTLSIKQNESYNIRNKSVALNVFIELYLLHGLPTGYVFSDNLKLMVDDYFDRKNRIAFKKRVHESRLKRNE
jgi:hypothetical protein